jgi:cell fate (sporulation/competence/biofilm development) regulator YlbF (YheA/YmcA/DUF963 family)
MRINDSAKDFVSAVKSTKEYTEFLQAKGNIEKNSSLKNQLYDFNTKLEEIYSSSKSPSMAETKVSELNRQFSGFFKTPEVDRFLKASTAFNEMMMKVYKSINESIDADLKFK